MGGRERSMEALGMKSEFWRGKRVLVTGHTGFKGGWVSLALSHLGASVHGLALAPSEDRPALFSELDLESLVEHRICDIRDLAAVGTAFQQVRPEVVFHLAAQSLVKLSYDDPVPTYATNVMGTVHVLEACRAIPELRSVVVVTSDKCYENMGWSWGYREIDQLGGKDPYSNSKACAEFVTRAYRDSFFGRPNGPRLASVRAGNVIGGGDWAPFRLIPDAMRAFLADEVLLVRNPTATRPWQHVLEPIFGYLQLAEALYEGGSYEGAWNFGPARSDNLAVSAVVSKLVELWGGDARWQSEPGIQLPEAQVLHVDSSKAIDALGWKPTISLDTALAWTVDWFKAQQSSADMRSVTMQQVQEFIVKRSQSNEVTAQ